MPARGFSTILRTSTILSKQFNERFSGIVVPGVIAGSGTDVQLHILGWVYFHADVAPLPVFGFIRRFVSDEVLILEVADNLIADAPELKRARSW